MTGRVALVTGGTRGIGLATALAFARRGADLVLNYFSSRTTAEAAAAEVRATGRRCLLARANIGNPEHIERMFGRIEREFGRLDFLVNNAALAAVRPIAEIEPDAWRRTMDVNVLGAFLCTRHAARLMNGDGAVVSVSSLGARFHLPTYADIGAAKAALEGLTRSLAVDLAPIRVNAVSAGAVDTRALSRFPWRAEAVRDAARVPAGRMVTPEDVAAAILFLCSPDAEMIRGQTIVVDGGQSLLLWGQPAG
jgi:enoyl-[acyl-carrier protein] reductase III